MAANWDLLEIFTIDWPLQATVALACILVHFVVTHQLSSRKCNQSKTPAKQADERRWGDWTIDQVFTYPPISAHPASNLAEIEPIAYRPFKGGAYHVTMGTRSLAWDEWIELDKQFPDYHRIKSHRIRTRGNDAVRVLGATPGVVGSGRLAAVEYVHELAEYLHRRYPSTFCITRNASSHIDNISVAVLGLTYQLPPPLIVQQVGGSARILDVTQEDAVQAMQVAALLVQEDIAIMIEGQDGLYYFQAGSVCIPGSWRMKDKIGLPLHEIHTSGKVPQFEEKLRFSLERFFRRMTVDKPTVRNNYYVQIVQPEGSERRANTTLIHLDANCELGSAQSLLQDDYADPEELAWSRTILGEEHTFDHNQTADSQSIVTPQTIRLRSERQTLRRLPLTGAIAFGIRTYTYPMEALAKERDKGVPGRLASSIQGWPKDVGQYKGVEKYGHILVPYLEQEQAKSRTGMATQAQYPF